MTSSAAAEACRHRPAEGWLTLYTGMTCCLDERHQQLGEVKGAHAQALNEIAYSFSMVYHGSEMVDGETVLDRRFLIAMRGE